MTSDWDSIEIPPVKEQPKLEQSLLQITIRAQDRNNKLQWELLISSDKNLIMCRFIVELVGGDE